MSDLIYDGENVEAVLGEDVFSGRLYAGRVTSSGGRSRSVEELAATGWVLRSRDESDD